MSSAAAAFDFTQFPETGTLNWFLDHGFGRTNYEDQPTDALLGFYEAAIAFLPDSADVATAEQRAKTGSAALKKIARVAVCP